MNNCAVCGEEHSPDVTLSFDGFGVNSCGNYRARLATFTSAASHKQVNSLGPLFASAPELYVALESLLVRAANDSGFDQSATDYGLANCAALATARAALAKARGE